MTLNDDEEMGCYKVKLNKMLRMQLIFLETGNLGIETMSRCHLAVCIFPLAAHLSKVEFVSIKEDRANYLIQLNVFI
jgi:hypothetical protein